MSLIVDNNLGPEADDVYACLLDATQGLTVDQAHRFNARLVLLLLNQVGDSSAIREAIEYALSGIQET